MDLGDAVIVGAGPVGLVIAFALADLGLHVHVFEGRSDPRKATVVRGRSINLTLTRRGWKAIRHVGLEDRIRALSTPVRGRIIHLEGGDTTYQAYGSDGPAIDCVSRPELTAALLTEAETRARITLHFGWRCLSAAPEEGRLTFMAPDGSLQQVVCERLLAADGAMSTVRSELSSRSGVELSQTYCKHFYKELDIPPRGDGSPPFDPHAFHIWPRGDCLLAAFANHGRGFTCTLFLPMHGERSFNALGRPQDLREFFATSFGDIVQLMPQLQRDFYTGAPSPLVTVKCYPWVFGRLALIGDAAHAMFPFLGQGLNAGLEDVSVLLACLSSAPDWERALGQYQVLRKPNCDAVTDIAAQHYEELAQSARNPDFVLRKRLETRLGELFPDDLVSPYQLVTFSERPYVEAQQAAAVQEQIIERLLSRHGLSLTLAPELLDREIISAASAVLQSKGRKSESGPERGV